jgi:hypothetical protein
MKNWIGSLTVVAALALPIVARAHEGHVHKALGTISSVHSDHVEIETTDGKTLKMMLDKKTSVMRGKDRLDTTALHIGDRVSVEYREAKKVMTAHTFKLGTTPTAKK